MDFSGSPGDLNEPFDNLNGPKVDLINDMTGSGVGQIRPDNLTIGAKELGGVNEELARTYLEPPEKQELLANYFRSQQDALAMALENPNGEMDRSY